MPRPVPYWSVADAVARGAADQFRGSDAEAVEQLESLLLDAVRMRMVADVPVGAFLSGGIDSSTIVALMQRASAGPVKTFTIGFKERGFDEAVHAKKVALHLGTEHHELYVSEQQAMEVIPSLPDLYDEPFADSSQIPTFLVAQLARQRVTVSLSGDAGDELFGGYPRYMLGRKLSKGVGLVPRLARRPIASVLEAAAGSEALLAVAARAVPRLGGRTRVLGRVRKAIEVLRARGGDEIYSQLLGHWPDSAELVVGAGVAPHMLSAAGRWPKGGDIVESMMFADTLTYLPDDILVKVDRATMGVSLEARVPLLDHRVVEFAWRLPLSLRVRGSSGKWLLRQVLYRHVPRQLIDRPKMGFGVPVGEWLRGKLRDWAEALLEPKALRDSGLAPAPIRARWEEHLTGAQNWEYPLWDILMLQAWMARRRARTMAGHIAA